MSLTTYKDDDDASSSDAAMSVEMMDPAIVMRGNVLQAPRFTYTRERLFEIREFPLSKYRPKFLENSLNHGLARNGNAQERNAHPERKRPETPNDDNLRPEVPENIPKRRSGDPRERIRKEQDWIVLSPQRRSFNLGCSAPLGGTTSSAAPTVRAVRPESPGITVKPDIMHRAEMGPRRIGSGRIVTRDMAWDYKGENESQEYNFRPGGGSSGPGPQINRRENNEREIISRDDRYERRSFGRDYDRDKDNRRNGNRYNNNDRRRHYSESKDEEPEWYSGGPTSQNDTIELRGFEDIPEERNIKRKSQVTQKRKNSKEGNQVNGVPIQRKTSTSSLNDSKLSTKENSPPKGGPGGRSTPKLEQMQMIEPDHSPVQNEDSKNELINCTNEKGLFDKNIEVNRSISSGGVDDSMSGKKAKSKKEGSKGEDDEQPDILDDLLNDSSWVGFYPVS